MEERPQKPILYLLCWTLGMKAQFVLTPDKNVTYLFARIGLLRTHLGSEMQCENVQI